MELAELRRNKTKILVQCKLRPENINCFYSLDRIQFSDSERSFIDKVWNIEVNEKPAIFDGKLFHVNKQEFLQSRLTIHTTLSSFKEWVGTKSMKSNTEFALIQLVRPLSVGSMIVTSDNKWIIGRRHDTYDFEGWYTLPAGYMDPDKDVGGSKPNPFSAIKREIQEETGINQNQDIDCVTCLGTDGIDQPYLAFLTRLRVSHKELISDTPVDKEFKKLEAYPYEKRSIREFIMANYEKLTPHTLANMLMSYDVLEM